MNDTRATRIGLAVAGVAVAVLGMTVPANANAKHDDCGAYCPTGVSTPSGNGNGNGNAYGKPAAGTVGNADSKNPPGQAPDASDHNNGYECDENSGVGKGNPAHSGCGDDTSSVVS